MESEELLTGLLKRLEGYVKFDQLTFNVDWEEIEKLKENQHVKRTEILKGLEKLHILTYGSKDNYGLIGAGVEINPSSVDGLSGRNYFTREQDARDYKNTVFKNVQYSINIVKYLD
jgi:hypothetical protein